MQQRTTQTSNEKSLLTEVIYSYYKTFRIVKPDSNGVYPPVWFPGSNEPDPAVDVQLKVNLHILWQEQRYALDLNEVFDVQNHILQMNPSVPNLAGMHEINGPAVRKVFEWLHEIMYEAETRLKTGELGFDVSQKTVEKIISESDQPSKATDDNICALSHRDFTLVEVAELSSSPKSRSKWELLSSGNVFVNQQDKQLQYDDLLRRIMRDPSHYRITKVHIPSLQPGILRANDVFDHYEICSFKLTKLGKFYIRIIASEEFDDDFDVTYELNKINVEKVGKLLFPNWEMKS